MDIIQAHAVKNLCYLSARKMVPWGIVVHSTGANNPNLSRYVDCPEQVGANRYNNHWNTPTPGGRQVCVHAFIGYDKNKEVRVAEILPLDICCWGVGKGSKGSYNTNPPHVQFEICEDGLQDEVYYRKAFGVAASYCAYLCKKFSLTVQQIVSHKEAHARGYGCNHGDPEHWMKNFGEDMNDFRKLVATLLQEETITTPVRLNDGDLVSIAENATYYSGKPIPDWVKSQNWYVAEQPNGNRVVIDKNESGTNTIRSPVHAMYLTLVKSAKPSGETSVLYLVKVTAKSLNIRTGPGINTEIVGCITDSGVYTIVETRPGPGASAWGKLKSGAGWISLDYTTKI